MIVDSFERRRHRLRKTALHLLAGLQRAVRPYVCELEPREAHLSTALDRFGRMWVRLVPKSGRYPTGWVEVDVEADSPDPSSSRLYADNGSGTLSRIPAAFTHLGDGHGRAIARLPDRVADLFLDPGATPDGVTDTSARVRELTRVHAALRLGIPLVRSSLRDVTDESRPIAQLVGVYRSEGWAATKRRFLDQALGATEVIDYPLWLRLRDELTATDRTEILARSVALRESVTFTVALLGTGREDVDAIDQTLESCDRQLFQRWSGVVLAPEGVRLAAGVSARLAAHDRWTSSPLHSGREFVVALQGSIAVFVKAGEQLAPSALYLFAERFVADRDLAAAYSDEDVIEEGRRVRPVFKPDWSPYRLLGQDYLEHRVACRAHLLSAHMPDRIGSDPLRHVLLAAVRHGATIGHLPFVLWHTHPGDGSDRAADRATVEDHLRVAIPGATLEPGKLRGTWRIRPPLPEKHPLVSIVIPTRDRADLLKRCIDTIRANTRYEPFETVICDNDSNDALTVRYLTALQADEGARVVRVPGEFNFAAIVNSGVAAATGEILVLLNNDVEVRDPTWLEELVGWAVRDDVGAVGCRLTFGDQRLQHAGIVVGLQGLAGHEHRGLRRHRPGRMGGAWVLREVSAVTAACLAIRKAQYDRVGGLDEQLKVAFNDVDLCLRLRNVGQTILFTPFAELVHHESRSRSKVRTSEQRAETFESARYVLARHGSSAVIDPFYNPNLSLKQEGRLDRTSRVDRPWHRTDHDRRRITFLAYRLTDGYGVSVVVAEQVEYFCARGWSVSLVVVRKDAHFDPALAPYIAARRLRIDIVASADEAIRRTAAFEPDVAVAHTPPFYDVLLELPIGTCRVLFDHGEPPAEFFVDATRRRAVVRSKVGVSRGVDLSVAVSEFVRADSGLINAQVCRNGTDHLLRRRSNIAGLTGTFRTAYGLGDAFIVLNVTRFLRDERRYKGVDDYVRVRAELIETHPELADRVRFVIAGRADASDCAWAEEAGLIPVPNVDDDTLLSAYLDADLYVSMSRWEGFNLGVAQALSLGVPTVASAAGAHPEFPVRTSNDPRKIAAWVAQEFSAGGSGSRAPVRRLRNAIVEPWRDAGQRLEALIESRLSQEGPGTDVSEAATFAPFPVVSFLILNRDKPQLIQSCLRSIERECGVPYEILIGDTGSTDGTTLMLYETTPHQVHYLGFYNFSACNNILAARARGRYLVFLNNDARLVESDVREAIAYLDSHPDVGCLGSYLAYPDDTIQHAGIRICPNGAHRGIPEHFDKRRPIAGYPGMSRPRDVVAVTGAMLVIGADRFRGAGAFDEVYEEEAQDVDLCLRLRRAGLRSVMHPALRAYHIENATRTVRESPADRAELLRRFGDEIEREIYGWQVSVGLA